jgi:hypothetical protein
MRPCHSPGERLDAHEPGPGLGAAGFREGLVGRGDGRPLPEGIARVQRA